MKIKEVTEIETTFWVLEIEDKRTFTRFGPDIWVEQTEKGPIHIWSGKELERSFQDWANKYE